MVAGLARNWWAIALRGALGVLFGVVMFLWPGLTLRLLVVLAGAYVLVDGVFATITVGLRLRDRSSHAVWLMLEGLAGVVAGLAVIAWPGAATTVVVYVIAAWAFASGLLALTAAWRLRALLPGAGLLAVSGALSVLTGVAMALWPAAGALGVAWLIGGYAVLAGGLLLGLGWRLRVLRRVLDRAAREQDDGPPFEPRGPAPLPF